MADEEQRRSGGYWTTDPRTFQSRVKDGWSGDYYNNGAWHDPTNLLANDYHLYLDIYSVHTKTSVKFKAMLDNYNETVNTQLASEVLVGHPEPLRKVQTVDRSIAISLRLVAGDTYQAKSNLSDLGLFVKMLYPAAEVENVAGVDQKLVLAGGDPLFKIRFLNFLVDGTGQQSAHIDAKTNGLKGYIDGVTYNFDLDSGFYGGAGDEAGFMYPQLIKLSFNFFPFYSSTPAWETSTGQRRSDWKSKDFSHPNAPHAYRGTADGIGDSWSGVSTDVTDEVNEARMASALEQGKATRAKRGS